METPPSKNPEHAGHPKFALGRARAKIERILPPEILDTSEVAPVDADLLKLIEQDAKKTKDFSKIKMGNLKIFKLRPPIEKDGVSLEYSLERIDRFSNFTETFFRDENGNWRAHSELANEQKIVRFRTKKERNRFEKMKKSAFGIIRKKRTAEIIPFPQKTTSKF